jgi:hypothetical protein
MGQRDNNICFVECGRAWRFGFLVEELDVLSPEMPMSYGPRDQLVVDLCDIYSLPSPPLVSVYSSRAGSACSLCSSL